MAREDLQQLAMSFLEAFNNADWGHYREIIADDATYYEKGGERTADNARRTVAMLREYRTNTPGLKGDPSAWVIDEVTSTVAVEIAWRRIDTGDPLTVPGTFFFTIQGGKITHISEQHYYGSELGWKPCPITENYNVYKAGLARSP
jgi:ketosteroid isomerase-like protein